MPNRRRDPVIFSENTLLLEEEIFSEMEKEIDGRGKKKTSKLLKIGKEISSLGKANKKHKKAISHVMEKLFPNCGKRISDQHIRSEGENYLAQLDYLELRARRLRSAVYRCIKWMLYHDKICICLYWIHTNKESREAVQETISGPDFLNWNEARAVVYRSLYRSILRHIKDLKEERRRALDLLNVKTPKSIHPNPLVREAWILIRASEIARSFPSLPSALPLPANKFDATPGTLLRYLNTSKRREEEAESLFGPSAAILDTGLFHADFDEILKEDESWEKLKLRTKIFVKGQSPKKFRWVETIVPTKTMEQVLLPEKTKSDILQLTERHSAQAARGITEGLTFLFRGEPGTGKSLTAEALAHRMGKALLRVNFSTVDPEKVSDVVTFFTCRAQRTNSVLLFEECENIFRGNIFRGTSEGWAKVLFQDFKGVAIFTTNYDLGYGMARRMTYVHEFESETPEIRRSILMQEIESAIKENGNTRVPSPSELFDLVSRYEVPGGYFHSLLQVAFAHSPESELRLEALENAFAQRSKVMEVKKSSLETPKVSLVDIVLRPEQRETVERILELAKTNRSYHPLLPKCVSAIFHGPPGTGKTLVAEGIAHALGKRIHKATAADLLSMFVGESEKAIRRLFQNAGSQGYVLFIDEAEGLFRDRSAAVRSWELTQVNELLRQFDEFEGIVLLASNHKDAIDPAFARRIQFHVDFPMPSQDERKDLWKKFLGITKINLEESDLRLLTEGFTLSGGEIRNAVVQAQAHGVTDILRLCEICKGIETQRFGRTQRRVGLN